MRSERSAIIFIGIQGSGKTYYYERFLADAYAHISLDELHTRNKEMRELLSCMELGKNIVIDNTNPSKEERARYIPRLKAAGYKVAGYFFESRLQDCIRRNDQRVGKARLPANAIAVTSNRLEMPSKEEGFDELYFIKRVNGTDMIREEWRTS